MKAYYKKNNLIFEIGYRKKIETIKLVEKIPKNNEISTLSNYAFKEISLYLDGKLKEFSFPIKLVGSPFQISVWETIEKIPYGKTLSYKDIGLFLNSRAYQAIGSACRMNPLLLRIPCHRVLAKNGIGGFSYGLSLKKTLLRLENIKF